MPKSLIGVTFRSAYADGNPLWKIVRKAGPQAWEAVCEDEDWGGTVKLFSTKEINAHKSYEKMWKEHGNENDNFYASLKVGQTVHYCNGFKQYEECVVVKKDGKNVLMPVALKGEWQKWDLPQRLPDGLIHLGYHAKQIVNKETFTPNYSCILEYDGCNYRKDHSPEQVEKMPRIDLEVPPMENRQLQVAGIIGVLDSVLQAMEGCRKELYDDDGQKDLSSLKEKVTAYLEHNAKVIREMK